ncbi:MAG: branched-chain amino acid ABC transporter permease [Pseudomonadota bacterium]
MTAAITRRQALLWVLFVAIMLAMPQIVSKGDLRVAIQACYLAIFAMSWDFLSGRTGYISFGHPFLIGAGAYASAILNFRFDVPIAVSIPAGAVIAMAASAIFFLPALRIRGSYFALVTLAFMELMYQLVQVIRPDLTGGTRGMSGLDTLMRGAVNNYYFAFSMMAAIAIFLWLLTRTRLGAAQAAIGMDEDAVQGSGLNTTRIKLFTFIISAGVAGLGGALFVHYQGSIAPRALFDINFVFTIIVAALIGGAGSIVGPMAGAFFLTFLLQYMRPWLPGAERYLIYGGVALLLYMYQPKGLYEILRKARARWAER